MKPLLTTAEVCNILKITSRTLLKYRNREKNPFPKPAVEGYPNKWKQIDVENFINNEAA